MNVICEFSEKHIEQLHVLYQGEWWTRGRSLEDTKKCVLGSQLCIGIASENDDLIGFVRVLTDFTFKALIFDVIVAQSESNPRKLAYQHISREALCRPCSCGKIAL